MRSHIALAPPEALFCVAVCCLLLLGLSAVLLFVGDDASPAAVGALCAVKFALILTVRSDVFARLGSSPSVTSKLEFVRRR